VCWKTPRALKEVGKFGVSLGRFVGAVRGWAWYGGRAPQEPDATIEAIDEQDTCFQRGADSMIVAQATGEEFAPLDSDRRTLLRNMTAWYRNALVRSDTEVTHEQTGLKIKFDSGGGKKLTRLPNHLIRAVPTIPEILRKGRYAGSRPDTKGHGNIRAWHYFVGTVEVAGHPITVRLYFRERTDGTFLYAMDRQANRGGGWTESRAVQ